MKPFPKIHDLYIARVLLGTVLMVWMVLLGLDAVLALVGEIGNLGQGSYQFAEAAVAVLYTLPRRAYTLFPTAAVIGALMGLGQLAASSELTALRALGLSRKRLSVAVAGALVLLTGLMVISAETLGPWGQMRADNLRTAARSGDMIVARYSGLWAREGNVFLNAAAGQDHTDGDNRWLELRDLRMFEFDNEGRLQSIAKVDSATHRDGTWTLSGVDRTTFEPRSLRKTRIEQEHWDSQLDAATLASSLARPRFMPSADLKRSIEYRKRNGLDANEFEEHYWGRWFYPLNVLALCLAAVPFAFGTLRSGGLGRRLFIGIVFALGFWLLQTQFVRLASVVKLDYRLAYLIPPMIMLGVSWFLFRRRSG